MDIVKGRQYTLTAKFSRRGSPAVFVQPPAWVLYNSDDDELLSGTASPNGNVWEAIITVSNNYVVPDGKEALLLQFTGYDNKNNSYTKDIDLTIIDDNETFKPIGVIYNMVSPQNTVDTFITADAVTSYTVKVLNPLSVQVGDTITVSNPAYSRVLSGYQYTFSIPPLPIDNNIFLDPHQILIEYVTGYGSEMETHPLYILSMKTLNVLNGVKMYLDKARLIEIDPALQWHATELIQSILEGAKFINASPPDVTYWNLHAWPSTIDSFLTYGALFYALNMRYLAEGFQSFDFSGLNTTLNFNRTDFISTKMSEVQNILEGIKDIKAKAIIAQGKGEPVDGSQDMRVRNTGVLGLSANLLNRRSNGYFGMRRF